MKKLMITVLGKTYEVLVEDMGEVANDPVSYAEHTVVPSVPLPPVERNTETRVTAPMSGTVLGITVAVGDDVTAGAPLMTLEAMKMQNEIPAPKDGTIREILVRQGDSVSTGTLLFIID